MVIWDELLRFKEGKLPYKDAVALFFLLNPATRGLKSFFAVEDRYSKKRLKDALLAKYAELEANRQKSNFTDYGQSKFRSNPINIELLPPELRLKYARLSPIIREIASLHSRLYNCSTDDQRYELAARIYLLVAERRDIFTRLDEFNATGKILQRLQINTLKAKQGFKKNFEVEYKLKILRTKRTKLKANPRRIEEYNQVVKEIQKLEKSRYE
jgi:hypothetical protein